MGNSPRRNIIKKGSDYIIENITEEVYNLDQLESELSILENATPPTEEELIEAGRSGIQHYYYSPARQMAIDQLRSIISELRKA